MEVPVSVALWTSIPALPLLLTQQNTYEKLFPAAWYDAAPRDVTVPLA